MYSEGSHEKTAFGSGLDTDQQCTQHCSPIIERVIPDDISMYSCGNNFALFYSKSKGWFACGCFEDFFNEKPNGFTPIPSLAEIVPLCIDCGYGYAIVSTDGKLYINGSKSREIFYEIELSAPAKSVSYCDYTCIVLLESGETVHWFLSPDNRRIVTGKRFVDCACGMYHFVALTGSGEVWTWTTYSEEVYGCGREVDEGCEIGKVELPVKIKKVFACVYQTFLLDEENHIWATGDNECGQLGLGDRKERLEFTRVPEFTTERIIQIKQDAAGTCVLTESGKIFFTGYSQNYMTLIKGEKDFEGENSDLLSFTLTESIRQSY